MNILLSLGKNITIFNGKLFIEPNDWLVPIKDNYQLLEEEFLGLKLSNIEDLSTKNKTIIFFKELREILTTPLIKRIFKRGK
jgi:hypothetical protein